MKLQAFLPVVCSCYDWSKPFNTKKQSFKMEFKCIFFVNFFYAGLCIHREYFVESAGVRYFNTHELLTYQKSKKRLWYCVSYKHTETFIILAAFLF